VRPSLVARVTFSELSNLVRDVAAGRRRLSAPPGQRSARPPSISTRATSSVSSDPPTAHISVAMVDLPIPDRPTNARPRPLMWTALACSTRCPAMISRNAMSAPAARTDTSPGSRPGNVCHVTAERSSLRSKSHRSSKRSRYPPDVRAARYPTPRSSSRTRASRSPGSGAQPVSTARSDRRSVISGASDAGALGRCRSRSVATTQPYSR